MSAETELERANSLVRRAGELNDLANYPAALEAATLATELAAHDPRAHTVRAWALENLGGPHLDEARIAYETAIGLDPAGLRARVGLADILHRSGRPADAKELYRSIAGDTAAGHAEDAASLELEGWSLYRLDRLDDAIATFRRALERERDRIAVRFDLALALLAAERIDEAVRAYQDAVGGVMETEPARRRAPLTVASQDLAEALATHPKLATSSRVKAVATTLRRALVDAPAPAITPSD
jgi:tetratricopeptide (TPR) repeat protein